MAVTSIWSVKGWLGKVVIYVENPLKTSNPKYYQQDNDTHNKSQGLSDVIAYATDPKKTEIDPNIVIDNEDVAVQKEFIAGVNCNIHNARNQMLRTKKQFGKEDGVVAYHGYQSFAEGEVTPEMAHEIGVKLAQQLWGKKYQVIIATHLDKDTHIHNHFIVNSISFVDGIRYRRTEKDYYNMRTISDELCKEYGLSVIKNPKRKGKHYAEWKAEKEGLPTYKGLLKADIDEAIANAITEKQFFQNLVNMGYEIKRGKDITVKAKGRDRGFKIKRNFGDDYSIEAIRKRIINKPLAQQTPTSTFPITRHKRHKVKGSLKTAKKATGFRALYYHYCYKMRIFPKHKRSQRTSFSIRSDVVKLKQFSEETRLLVELKIDTMEQLTDLKTSTEDEIKEITANRGQLYKKIRRRAVKEDEVLLAALKGEIATMSQKLKKLRKKVKMCESIAERSVTMKKNLKEAHQEREVSVDDKRRRRGRNNI